MKGIYVLIIRVHKNIHRRVGALGDVNLRQGLYAYVGSAQTNLEKRVARHFKTRKLRFWHIDHLLSRGDTAHIVKVFYRGAGKSEECRVAEELSRRALPVKGFGSSDCRCKSHLFKLCDYQFLNKTMQEMSGQSLEMLFHG